MQDPIVLQAIRLRRRCRWPTVAECQPAASLSRPDRISNRSSAIPERCGSARTSSLAGTTGGAAGDDDIAAQTREALRRIEIALEQTGATLSDVIRTRIYVTDISRWREVAAVHADVFGEIRPATTMVEVAALITPDLLVEIEADAYVTR